MAHAAYFDAILFGRLLLLALINVRPGTPIDEAPEHIATMVQSRTGHDVDPQEIAAVIDGTATRACDVPTFRAIIETLEPPAGAHWFDPAFDPEAARHFWDVCLEREVQ
jgi:hypothetical protein